MLLEATSDYGSGCHSNPSSPTFFSNQSFQAIRAEHQHINTEVRAIIRTHAQTGLTIQEIKAHYYEMVGSPFPVYNNITEFLLTIPWVTAYCNSQGTLIFNVKPTEETSHLHELILKQRQKILPDYSIKRARFYSGRSYWETDKTSPEYNNFNDAEETQQHLSTPTQRWPNLERTTDTNNNVILVNDDNTLMNDNQNYDQAMDELNAYEEPTFFQNQSKYKRKSKRFYEPKKPKVRRLHASQIIHDSKSPSENTDYSNDSDYEAHLLDFLLMGDDFLMYLARMELKCKFKLTQGVLNSGYCVSGQTIKAAYERIRQLPLNVSPRNIIINLGSVDILQNIPLVRMQYYYRLLINELKCRGWKPIVTTLAPLANLLFSSEVKQKLNKFNTFLKTHWSHVLTVIDIHKCMVNELNEVSLNCYQHGPRFVSGARQPHVFWSKFGRQKVLQLLELEMEY